MAAPSTRPVHPRRRVLRHRRDRGHRERSAAHAAEPEKFAARVRKLGLGDGNRIVVYDQLGLMSAARVW
jgi:3-mercaptopyruvate sulfurtransferase SseA